MPTRNRGKRSSDDKWFAPRWHPVFREAVDDLCWLLTRGYTGNSALQMVGNRYKLNKRQRTAIWRISSGKQDILTRKKSRCSASALKNKAVAIDGFNLLILLESALSGAYVFKCRDQTYRDISSVHGSYKRVVKTEESIMLIGRALKQLKVASIKWYLDKPVSNSGMLKTKLLEMSRQHHFNWEVSLVANPDKTLIQGSHIVITSDGWILDKAKKWFNLGAYIIERYPQKMNVIIV